MKQGPGSRCRPKNIHSLLLPSQSMELYVLVDNLCLIYKLADQQL